MCGIFGEISIKGKLKTNKRKFLESLKLLSHRGPDNFGFFFNNEISLGHKRLSIIDLSKKGKQPMFSADKKHMIVFNGEIYNYKELKEDLIQKGFKFHNDTDTEVLLNGIIDQGAKFVNKCNGMFAFAYYNFKNKKTLIFRDRIGIKPLFYHVSNNKIIFSSEIRPINFYSGFKNKIDLNSVYSYLSFRQPIGNDSYFREIKTLTPGFYLEISNQKIFKKKYWDYDKFFQSSIEDKGEDYYIERLKELVASSVNYRLTSDVNVASLLSGGVDSSIISNLISKNNNKSFNAYSIGYKNKGYNEFNFSSMVAKKSKLKHVKYLSDSREYFEDMEKMIYTKGQPISIPNEVTQYRLCKKIKKHATVVLSGTGADELFLGYGRIFGSTTDYFKLKSKSYFDNSNDKKLFLKNFNSFYKRKNFKNDITHFNHLYSYNSKDLKKEILSEDFNVDINEKYNLKFVERLFQNKFLKSYQNKMQYFFTKYHLKGILERDDFSSMLASVELRVPFLDHRIVEFSATIPNKYKLKIIKEKKRLISEQISEIYDIPKYILKKTFRNSIPDQVSNRLKVGFPVPLHNWINNKNIREKIFSTLSSQKTKNRGILNQKFIKNILDNKNLFDDNNIDSRKYQYSLASSIWMCYNLELFFNHNQL